ncbi:hypothetical protein WAI453_009382 [Rhynchosporium graminicola]
MFFADTDPSFVIDFMGPSHKLILKKYYILDHLNRSDFSAAWNVLTRLESRHMVINNCGVEAYKHLQVLLRPDKQDFELFPDALGILDEQMRSENCHSNTL